MPEYATALTTDLLYSLKPSRLAPVIGINLDGWQERVLDERAARVLLNCHRQAGKSTIAGLAASHEATYNPGSITLLVSPSQRQSGELFRKVMGVYKTLWKAPRIADAQGWNLAESPSPESETALTLELENGSRIISLPGKDDSTIRGYSAVSLIVVDEAAMVTDSLRNAVRPMLAVSGGRMLALSTPKGKRGWFYEAWDTGPEYDRETNPLGWLKILATADHCPRITKAFLAEELANMGPRAYAQEYMGEFVETIDQVFSQDAINKAFKGDVEPLF